MQDHYYNAEDLARFGEIGKNRPELADLVIGWTIEMQVKAAQQGLGMAEMPVTCRPRQAGRSKVSGTLSGSYGAGKRILGYVFEAKVREVLAGRRASTMGDNQP